MQPQRDSVRKNSIPKVEGALPPGTLQRTLAIIMGGGAGTRLFPLTKDRAKPAVPLGGKYRIVDIPISNCLNSGLRSIYVLTQFNSMSLHRHIQASYKFDNFSRSFIDILAAQPNRSIDIRSRSSASCRAGSIVTSCALSKNPKTTQCFRK